MALNQQQSLSLYGTEAYTGWDEAGAREDFKKKNNGATQIPQSSGGSGGFDYSVPTFDPNSIPVSQADPYFATQSVNIDDYIKAIQDTLPVPPTEYLKANPFYFDEQAAREVSTAEFSPYYSEMLGDYMSDVKITSEKNRGDVTRILTDLEKQKEIFMRDNSQELNKTLRGIKEGYSGRGLYFSGFTGRDTGEAQSSNTNQLESYLNTYTGKTEQAKAEDTYTQSQLATDASRKARDIGRQQTADVYGGIQTQKNEAIDEYLYGMQKYYQNPNWKSMTSETGNTLQQQGKQF